MKLISFLFTFVTIFSVSSVFAETTTPGAFGGAYYDGKNSCQLRVRNSGYIIRRSPNARGREKTRGNCAGTLRSSNLKTIMGLASDGNWIKVGHPSCPGGVGYVYYKAFYGSDVKALRNGQCAAMANYGYRNAPKAPKPDYSGSVRSKGSNQHRFVMDRCLGIRNDKYGSGYYGASRGGGKRTHAGCDYRAPVGTPLKSPCNGRVSRSGYVGAAGNLLEIICDNGDKFKMMHLHSGTRRAKAGTRVGIGTMVGAVGKTGNANVRGMIPHVHLQAVIRGRRVDPQKLWSCGR